LESKTKFAEIALVISAPALEVVDHVAGIQFGFTAQPVVFAGCGPLFSTSTLFCAATGVTLSSNTAPQKDNISSFFIAFSLCCRSTAKRTFNHAQVDVE
jgi:hypothetical protein